MLRRECVRLLATGLGLAFADSFASPIPVDDAPADATLHISTARLEIAAHRFVKTTAYNGAAPGPFLRFRENQRVNIDVFNDTNKPELVHWHGL